MLTIPNDYGEIRVEEEAIKRIVASVLPEVPGIAGMVSNNLKSGINELLGREDYKKGVEIDMNEEEKSYAVTLHLAVQFGTKIYEVVRNVQERIRYDLENLVGVAPHAINVVVRGIRIDELKTKEQ